VAEDEPSAALFAPTDIPSVGAPPFMELQDPRYAYMFGFLQADGCLTQGVGQKGRLTVEISIRDIGILRQFQRLTPYNSSIRERTRRTNFAEAHHSAIWTLCSLSARTQLNRLGLPYGRKSTKITPPRVPFSRRDYLRGIIDADGSVGYTAQGFPFLSLTTASTAVGAYLCRYAVQVTGAQRVIKRNRRDGIYNIVYTKEAAQRLGADLYYPGCLALERKRDAGASLAEWERPADMRTAPDRRRWKEWEDRILLDHGHAASGAEALGRTERSCEARLWRLRTGRAPMPSVEPEGF
jgi:hypothetical protein